MIRKKEENRGPIIVDLTGPEGNAFVLRGFAEKWSKQLGLDYKKIDSEMAEGDYEHLLQVLDKYFGEFVIFER